CGTLHCTSYLSATERKKPSSIQTFGLFLDAKGKKAGPPQTKTEAKTVKAAISRGEVIAAAGCRARDFLNEPASAMTPTQLAEEAKTIADKHKSLSVKIFNA